MIQENIWIVATASQADDGYSQVPRSDGGVEPECLDAWVHDDDIEAEFLITESSNNRLPCNLFERDGCTTRIMRKCHIEVEVPVAVQYKRSYRLSEFFERIALLPSTPAASELPTAATTSSAAPSTFGKGYEPDLLRSGRG